MDTPAKINLLLRITGKMACNDVQYHQLETIFWPLPTLCDTVEIQCTRVRSGKSPRISLKCNLPGVPTDQSNLCCKAATLFLEETKIIANADITLTKRIPMAAGLGGGSSDAAATLLELWTLLTGNDSRIFAQLPEMAKKLGADVPFFLKPVPSLATGIGEKLSPLMIGNTREFPRIVLVYPRFPVSARWAYQQWDLRHPGVLPHREASPMLGILRQGNWNQLPSTIENDLEPPLFDKFSLLEMIRHKLLEQGAQAVHVSGSGPTLFALFSPDFTEQSPEFCQIRDKFPQCDLFLI